MPIYGERLSKQKLINWMLEYDKFDEEEVEDLFELSSPSRYLRWLHITHYISSL